MQEYALYKGDDLLGIGTLEELAEMRGVKPKTIYFYSTPCHQRRVKNVKKILVAIKLDD